MSVKLYGIPGSPYVRSVMAGLEEKQIPYDFVALAPADIARPEYLARQPFGRVPAFEHDGFALYETQAILRYLDGAFDGPALIPHDPKERARMDQLVGVCDWYLFPQVGATIGFERVVKPLIGLGPADEAAIAKAVPDAERCFSAINTLARAPFLTGAHLSIADLMLACHMNVLMATAECHAIVATYPKLRDWLVRMEERPSMRKTDVLQLKAA